MELNLHKVKIQIKSYKTNVHFHFYNTSAYALVIRSDLTTRLIMLTKMFLTLFFSSPDQPKINGFYKSLFPLFYEA